MRMRIRRSPSLLALRAFEAAARRLSFTDAARELHVSQAAISRHVRSLEKRLGRDLFRRLHRTVELTGPGKRLAGELEIAFNQISRAVAAIENVPARHLRLSVEPAFAARWLVPRLDKFSGLHPDIELQLESSDNLRVLGKDTDVAIRYVSQASRRPRGASARGRRLLSVDGAPIVAGMRPRPDAWRRDDAVLGFRLLHDDDGTEWRRWFAAAGLEGFEGLKHLYFTDYSLAIAAALRGQGVALGTPAFIAGEVKSGRLARLGSTRIPFGDYLLLESTDRATATPRAAFVRWVESEIGGAGPRIKKP
jgi:LysR family transcriptional regulator, glycine cleavage system transcriptional activator